MFYLKEKKIFIQKPSMQKFESTTLPSINQNFTKPIVPYWNSNEFSHFQEPFTATVE